MAFIGDFFTLYLAELLMKVLGLDWTVFIMCFSFLLLISVVLVHLYVEEYPLEYKSINSLLESIRDKLENMKLIFYHSRRITAVTESVLFLGFYCNILLWFPYYFTSFGYAFYATHLSALPPLLIFLGCLAFEYLIKFCPNYSHWFISTLLLVASFGKF